MNRVRNLLSIFGGIAFVMIILDSKLTLEGAQTGMDLCIRTVIPALFPFVVLSTLLSVSTVPCSQLIRTAAGFLGIPADASTVLIPAFLGGYPVGAKCVYTLYCTGRIEKSQAERLLTFCSNAGPSFLFGIVSGCFTKPETAWILWLIHVVASILTAISIPEIKPICPDKAKNTAIREETDILLSSIKAMGVICGWVILFRVLITFLEKWCLWLLPQWLQVLTTGLLEITNGCCELLLVGNEKQRFVLCSCLLSFGGICVLMQTVSVTKGLSILGYLVGKIMQTGFSLLLSLAVILKNGWLLFVTAAISMIFRKIQKNSGNLKLIPV